MNETKSIPITENQTPGWLSILRPVGICRLEPLVPRGQVQAWHVLLEFVRWHPPASSPKLQWNETYGKTQILRNDGSRTVAEIELVRRFRDAGWQAAWVDTYGKAPESWAEWILKPELPDSLPEALGASYAAITSSVSPKGSGRPDIIAWRGDSLAGAVFVESKGIKEKILADQEKWFREALKAGASQNQFAIARWRESKA